MTNETELSPSDLDELMSRDPLSLSSQDLDNIIKYHRRQRERRASGEKPTKPGAGAPKVDLNKLLGLSKPGPKVDRRM